MKFKKLISSLSAIAILAATVATYAADSDYVSAYGDEKMTLSNDLYSADLEYHYYNAIRLPGKQTMSIGMLSGFCAFTDIDELQLPSVVSKNSGYDIAVMELIGFDCSKIKSLILPDTMLKLNMQGLINIQELEYLTIPQSITQIAGLDKDTEYKFAIRGNIGSYAEKFAKDNNIRFIASGDIDSNNKFDANDINQLKEYMFGKSEMKTEAEKRADLDFNQELDIVDYIMLKNTVANPPVTSCGASTADALAAPDMGSVKSQPCTESQISGYEEFAAESANEVLLKSNSGNENPVYSPFSIYSALAMAAECSAENTQKEILDVLNADSIDALRSDHNALFSSLYFDNFDAYCKISNSLWLNEDFTYKQNTLERIADSYYAPSFSKNLSLESTADEISNWVYENTSGKIKPKIEINKDESIIEVMKIINTVTFKSQWISPFGSSYKDTFTLSDSSEIECDFLGFDSDEEKVGFGENFMKYSLPMKNGYKMEFVLPDENVSVEDIISDSKTMKEIYSDDIDYAKRMLFFKTPKFNVYSSYDLIPALQSLGMLDAFDISRADFSGVIDSEKNHIANPYINLLNHDATIMIDEQGCEAAAYTIISLAVPSCMPLENEPVYFYLDRPFYYYVSNSDGIPVFSGIINNPTETSKK